MKKKNVIFNFLKKILINVIKSEINEKNNNHHNSSSNNNPYLLLFIEFIRRIEFQYLIEENKKKFRKIFFQFLYLFLKSNSYTENLLILQILNILYNKISICINKNIVMLLYNKLLSYNNDMFISVLVNELLIKITKTVSNLVCLLDLYMYNKNEVFIESLLYNWFLNIKRNEKKNVQGKRK